MAASKPSYASRASSTSEGGGAFVVLTQAELDALVTGSLLVPGTQYYAEDTDTLVVATSTSSFVEVATHTNGGMMPYIIPLGEKFTIPANKQGLIGMDLVIDGTLVNNGFLVEV